MTTDAIALNLVIMQAFSHFQAFPEGKEFEEAMKKVSDLDDTQAAEFGAMMLELARFSRSKPSDYAHDRAQAIAQAIGETLRRTRSRSNLKLVRVV